ncbi:hypothetical protein NST58_01650 [Paenibacillus sp. FSL R10-2796]|uniref:hypothetical protein n=1 Tax=Paenibacillus sp. FSL R10-2796 TaxID=2954663 RepID=UPI0030DB8C74
MTQRDWQKDMEMCEAATKGPWIAKSWTVPKDDQYNITSEHDNSELYTAWQGTRYPGGPEVSEYQAKLNAIFAAESRTALPYWIQEAKERGEREQQLKEAIEEALKWTWYHGEANMTEIDAVLNDILSTLYPDTPAQEGSEDET